MKMKISDPHGLRSLGLQDDLFRVIQVYSLTEESYVGVTKQENVAQITEHWPLLEELMNFADKLGKKTCR